TSSMSGKKFLETAVASAASDTEVGPIAQNARVETQVGSGVRATTDVEVESQAGDGFGTEAKSATGAAVNVHSAEDRRQKSRSGLPSAARRALAEADERRSQKLIREREIELGGQKGPDPVRYGDWEKGGIASDF
ncbi:MAG: DUF1674 domain-containing protein, partial [Hyphomicrobiaceae bacterium]